MLRALEKPPGFSWRTVFDLAAVVRQWRPDIIHTHNIGTLIYTVLALPWMPECVLLHGEHAEFSDSELVFKRRLQRRFVYSAVHRLVPVSTSLAQHLVEHGADRSKITAIPNGVDSDRFQPGDRAALRAKHQFPPDAFIVGSVGRFGEFKRQDMLVEAFNILAANVPDAYLLLVGAGGPNESKVKELVSASPHKERIRMAGFQQDPREFYQIMDMLVMASTVEGLSNAALEAMSTEVPVLCHTSCGAADIIENGKTGYAVPLNKCDDVARNLAQLAAKRKELRRMGQAAREYIVKQHSIHSMIKDYAALYREVVTRR